MVVTTSPRWSLYRRVVLPPFAVPMMTSLVRGAAVVVVDAVVCFFRVAKRSLKESSILLWAGERDSERKDAVE